MRMQMQMQIENKVKIKRRSYRNATAGSVVARLHTMQSDVQQRNFKWQNRKKFAQDDLSQKKN